MSAGDAPSAEVQVAEGWTTITCLSVKITNTCSLAFHESALKTLMLQSVDAFAPGVDGGRLKVDGIPFNPSMFACVQVDFNPQHVIKKSTSNAACSGGQWSNPTHKVARFGQSVLLRFFLSRSQ
jgi:hypothetical protein